MKRQWVPVLSMLALVVLAAPSSGVSVPAATTAAPTQTANNSSLGANISSFMQVSSVEAESEVDRRMFSAALANAPNESVRQRLLERRADRLSERLDAVQRNLRSTDGGEGARRTVERTVADAQVDALERSVADVGELANRTGGPPPGFEQLRENVRGLREPSVPPVLDTEDDADHEPLGNGDPGNPNAGGGNEAPGQSGQAGDDGNSASNPGDGNGGTSVYGDGVDVPNSETRNGASSPGNGQNTGDGQNTGEGQNGGGASGSDDGPTMDASSNVSATPSASKVTSGDENGAGDGGGASSGNGSSDGKAPGAGNEHGPGEASGAGQGQGDGKQSNDGGSRDGESPNGGESASLFPAALSRAPVTVIPAYH